MPDAAPAETATSGLRVLQTGLNWFANGSGGLDRVYFDLAATLPAFGVQVRGLVVGPPDVGALTGGAIQTFAAADAGLPRRLLAARRSIARLADSSAFDLIAPHFALHVATALDRLRRVPMVLHFHGPWAGESAVEGQRNATVSAKRLLERRVYRRADRIIVLSQAFADIVVADYRVSPGRVHVVPGGVSLDRFSHDVTRDEARQALGWPCNRPILLSVRRLTPRMGLERLIDAMAQVKRRVPDVLLYIAGKGREEAALRRRVAEAGLSDRVRLLGFVPDADLVLAYAAADVNVVPSVMLEGFGLTAAEAIATGTPSLVTPVGGLPEVVSALSPDLVLRGTDPSAIADGLIAALTGRLHLPGPEACRAYASARLDIRRAAARTAAIYRDAMIR